MIKAAIKKFLSYIVLVLAVIAILKENISFESFVLTLIWFELVELVAIKLTKGDGYID